MICRCVKTLKHIIKTIVFEDLEGCVRERKRYRTIINNYFKIRQQKHQKQSTNQSSVFDRKTKPNRPMERPIVEQELWGNEIVVRFVAGGQVITHARGLKAWRISFEYLKIKEQTYILFSNVESYVLKQVFRHV